MNNLTQEQVTECVNYMSSNTIGEGLPFIAIVGITMFVGVVLFFVIRAVFPGSVDCEGKRCVC